MNERYDLLDEIKDKRVSSVGFLSRNRERLTENQVKIIEDSIAFWDRLAAYLSKQSDDLHDNLGTAD